MIFGRYKKLERIVEEQQSDIKRLKFNVHQIYSAIAKGDK